ncbi:MAG TPA: cytidine deaminase [Candidatus Binatia bacterium]|nr:cytidine deaminase [Candidatus Binatia bacterium]
MSSFSTELTRRDALGVLGSAAVGLAASALPSFPQQSDRISRLPSSFSEKSSALLRHLLGDSSYSGQIPASSVAELAKNENTTIDQLMLALLPFAQSYSHAPISDFYVGVVVRGASGSLYTGANIEIPGQCLGFAVHAEQSALSNAYMHGEQSVPSLAVGGAPCGHCRQFIEEFSPDGEILILTPNHPARKLSTILPEPFSPAALGMKHGALPISETKLALAQDSSDPLTLAALDAAKKSYAPYSKSPSGISLRSARGHIYRGSYIENVAFNPSLSPLQVALAALIAAGEEYSAIQAVTLVEVQGPKISQRPVTETVLTAIAPKVKPRVFAATA